MTLTKEGGGGGGGVAAGVGMPGAAGAGPATGNKWELLKMKAKTMVRRKGRVLSSTPQERIEEHYQLGRVLGEGAYGVVRKAVCMKTGTRCAVKSITKAKLLDVASAAEVQKEVNIMNHLGGHSNIVNIQGAFEDESDVHLVMELCTGGELFDAIAKAGHYSEKKAAEVFRTMVEVVYHCHELGVIHRDLKPENFLLENKKEGARIKCTDFGLSCFFSPLQTHSQLVGTAYYIAPEVLNRKYTERADMWSLGVILYILLSGLPPFWGSSDQEIFEMVKNGYIDFETDPWPKISDMAKDCVSRLLTMDPAKRSTAAEILHHPWLDQEGQALDMPLDSVVLQRMGRFAALSRMKRMLLLVVGSCLSLNEISGMKRLFQEFDADGNGTITMEELRTALANWGHKIPLDEIQAVVEAADVDGDGTLDYNEFVAATMNMAQLGKEEVLTRTFERLDADGSGKISLEEMEEALKSFGVDDDMEDLMKAADLDGDGQIDYHEFLLMMREMRDNDLASASSSLRLPTGIMYRMSMA